MLTDHLAELFKYLHGKIPYSEADSGSAGQNLPTFMAPESPMSSLQQPETDLRRKPDQSTPHCHTRL
jgi:hypothetical protein